MQEKFMREAIRLAEQSVAEGGGPFGAVVVRKGEIVGYGNNRVTTFNDPTAHAEMVAIRDACRHLERFELSDCEIYASCEPCIMCLAASYWARLKRGYYAADAADAAAAGFDDVQLARKVCGEHSDESRQPKMRQAMRQEAQAAFTAWRGKSDKLEY